VAFRGIFHAKHLRKVHLDFHIPDWLDESAADYDAAKNVRLLRQSGVNALTLSAYCHNGNCLFPSKVGHVHKGMKGDYFGDHLEQCNEAGILTLAYLTVAWNDYIGRTHPDWLQERPGGQKIKCTPWWSACMNSPYREFIYSLLDELMDRYEGLAGFWLDITYVFQCHCRHCRQLFRSQFGYNMPKKLPAGSRGRQDVFKFWDDTRVRFWQDARQRIDANRPELILMGNHIGDPYFAQPQADAAAHVSARETHVSGQLDGSFFARYMRTLGRPFECITSRFHKGWSDFTLTTPQKLMHDAAVVCSNGGIISIGDQALPSGKLESDAYRIMQPAFELVKQREPWLFDAESLADVAVLLSTESFHLARWAAIEPNQLWPYDLDSARGAHKMLVEGNWTNDLIDESSLSDLGRYRALILPNTIFLSTKAKQSIRQFVRQGGTLISTQYTSLCREDGQPRTDFALADLMGLTYRGQSDYQVDYMSGFKWQNPHTFSDMPILLRYPLPEIPEPAEAISARPSTACLVKPSARTEVLAWISHPYCRETTKRFVSHKHPHPGPRSDWPAVTYHKYGRGCCIYFAAPIFHIYWKDNYSLLRRAVLSCLERVIRRPQIRVDAPLSVEVNLMRKGKQRIVHLVNYHAEKPGGATSEIEEMPAIRDIKIWMPARRATRATLQPDGTTLKLRRNKSDVVFSLPRLDLWSMIVVE